MGDVLRELGNLPGRLSAEDREIKDREGFRPSGKFLMAGGVLQLASARDG
jgi:hypothetical protein